MTTSHITQDNDDDEDLALLRKFMRPEEDLREYRRRMPWTGGYRYFRSANVVCIEHYRPAAQKPSLEGDRNE
jgi:hypothetical protein